MRIRRRSLVFLWVILLIVPAHPTVRQDALTRADLAGTYIFFFSFGGGAIMLNSDGTFTRESGACTDGTTEYGKYTISNNVLVFDVMKAYWKPHGSDKS